MLWRDREIRLDRSDPAEYKFFLLHMKRRSTIRASSGKQHKKPQVIQIRLRRIRVWIPQLTT